MARNIMSVFNQRTREDGMFEAPPVMAAPSHHTPSEVTESTSRATIKLGKTLVFKGELSVGEDVLLLGRVEGSFEHSETLTVGASGVIVGDVCGRAITVKGTVEGDIEATESVVIAPGAVVTGDIAAPRLNIIEGAQFSGSVKMTSPPSTDQPGKANLLADGCLTEEGVNQLLHMLSERKKA